MMSIEMHVKIERQLHALESLLTNDVWDRTAKFKNDIFEFNSYYWGNCNCDPHPAHGNDMCLTDNGLCDCNDLHFATCPCSKPNFKSKDFEVRWYKHIGRGMEYNRDISSCELLDMMKRCIASIK
jgi:hypothetical protein